MECIFTCCKDNTLHTPSYLGMKYLPTYLIAKSFKQSDFNKESGIGFHVLCVHTIQQQVSLYEASQGKFILKLLSFQYDSQHKNAEASRI